MRTLSTNKLTSHPSYNKILASYNSLLREKGKVNSKKFYQEVILKEIPDYSISSWYFFLKRFKTTIGIAPPTQVITASQRARENASKGIARLESEHVPTEEENQTAITIQTNQQATIAMVQSILNISAKAAQEVLENPDLISYEKRIELGLKMMKAQDSRAKTIGAMRADNREQERFDRAMDNAAFG